jgi:hypothetical protein
VQIELEVGRLRKLFERGELSTLREIEPDAPIAKLDLMADVYYRHRDGF